MTIWHTQPPQGFTPEQGLTGNARSSTIRFLPPQGLSEQGISPGVDTELIEETVGVFDSVIYDDGVETGFVLVEEV